MISSHHQEVVAMDVQTHTALLERVQAAGVAQEDVDLFRAIFESYEYVTRVIERREMSLSELRNLLFGSRTEKTRELRARRARQKTAGSDNFDKQSPAVQSDSTNVAEAASDPPSTELPATTSTEAAESLAKTPGHGRNGAADLTGAERVCLTHPTLKPGDTCPECGVGAVAEVATPKKIIRFAGQAPVAATVYELQRLRCNLCGQLFRTPTPPDIGEEKYASSVGVVIGMLKYGAGMPFHRLDKLQAQLELPLPKATQWMLVEQAASEYAPVFEALFDTAAQSQLLYNDDTKVRIQQVPARSAPTDELDTESQTADAEAKVVTNTTERTGLFTTAIVSVDPAHRIALYFSGTRHAGENLTELLRRRQLELAPPTQMCDALSSNYSREFQTIVANCLAHARRKFVPLNDKFPEEVDYVLDRVGMLFHHDALARQRQLTAAERLALHQQKSQPICEELHAWLQRQFSERLVETNSALGAAINYLLKHWRKLTLFLTREGAPLDSNLVERALKKAIIHRKNSLSYRTANGARVGDIHMSLIHTCELNQVNPQEYLLALRANSEAIEQQPDQWLPWNFREALARHALEPPAPNDS